MPRTAKMNRLLSAGIRLCGFCSGGGSGEKGDKHLPVRRQTMKQPLRVRFLHPGFSIPRSKEGPPSELNFKLRKRRRRRCCISLTLMTLWNKQDGLVLNHTAAAAADGRLNGAAEEEGRRNRRNSSRKVEFSGRPGPRPPRQTPSCSPRDSSCDISS